MDILIKYKHEICCAVSQVFCILNVLFNMLIQLFFFLADTRLGRFTSFSVFFGFILKPVCFGLAFTKTGKPSLPNCLLSSPETRFFPLSFRDFSVLYNYAIKILFFFRKVGKN